MKDNLKITAYADNDKWIYGFYENAVLPQFGIHNEPITWEGSQDLADEAIHYFRIGKQPYALIFEDAGGLGQNEDFIREYVAIRSPKFTFVEPTSQTNNSPSYDGFHLPVPCRYCFNVTGTFTLLKLEELS